MSTLFSAKGIPSILAHTQDTLTHERIVQGLAAMGFRKGSPGYTAIEKPVTPLDKAFQVYAVHLMHANGYAHEPYDHTEMWQRRDAAWTAAAQWLLETQDAFRLLDKTATRKIAKILPEAVRIQCSLELPPGPWEAFPRDGMKRGAEMNALTDRLQSMGLNIKIHRLAVLEGESPVPGRALPEDYGTLEAMLESIKAEPSALKSAELDLF